MPADRPNGISEILEFLAAMASGYDNHLKWNEVAKLKADLMNVRHRWVGLSVDEGLAVYKIFLVWGPGSRSARPLAPPLQRSADTGVLRARPAV